MFPSWFYVFVACGLGFAWQNKLPFLHHRFKTLDNLLRCTFCLGFHCGWMTWILNWVIESNYTFEHPVQLLCSLVCWCFAIARLSYALDTAVKRLETFTAIKVTPTHPVGP